VVDRIWDDDPTLSAQADAERERYRQSSGQEAVSLDDFYAYMPAHNYLYVPTRTPWPAASVNSRIPAIKVTEENRHPLLKDGKQAFP
jgi:hypothetical protein